jgi:uncharacterized damage-inducible protein DinB
MSICKLISNYSSYNEWANNEIVVWLKGLDKELLYQKTPSSFDSIDHTLQHILRVQKFWLAFISEEDISNFNWTLREGEVEKILDELVTVSNQMKIKFSSFTEAELLHDLYLDRPWAKTTMNRYEYMLHSINHTTYHRGQLITQSRCLGITNGIVNTDYVFFTLKNTIS